MNKFYISIKSIIIFLFIATQQTFGWGTDKIIFTGGPSSQHSMAAKQNGVLFAAMAGVGFSGPNLVTIFTSTDNGDNWGIAPIGGLPANAPVVKTKMVTTASDSVYCLFLQNDIIYIVNVESGVLGQLTTYTFKDFDAVASSNGNWIYIFTSRSTNNQIVRYGTEDGGVTWGTNTALVTGDGAVPRVTMSGTRLILNYYGPVLVDTSTSTIRAAFYDESIPGTLNPGTFQDLVIGNGIKRKQYKTALVNNTAWFMFTEGDAQQVIKNKVTQDGGATYTLASTVAGSAQVNCWWFDLASYSTPVGSGISMTCLADSAAPVIPSYDKLIFLGSSILTPTFVVPFPAPYLTYNDNSLDLSPADVLPVVVSYNFGSTNETGIAWVGDSPSGPWLYFDRLNATVGLNEMQNGSNAISVYPSPANDFIYIESELNLLNAHAELFDMSGKCVLRQEGSIPGSPWRFDISSLPAGMYIVQVSSTGRNLYRSEILVQ